MPNFDLESKQAAMRDRQNGIETPERQRTEYHREYYQRNIKHALWRMARTRARVNDLEFTINEDDIIIPEICPVLGIDIIIGSGTRGGKNNSPSVDRIDNSKGYIVGNVVVVSFRANSLKSDATLEELRKLADFYCGSAIQA